MDINEILEHIQQNNIQGDIGLNTASMYFENNKDLVVGGDFLSMMALGCFDKEFTYYGVAYLNAEGEVCYRISTQRKRMHQFVEQSASENIYPTPVLSNVVLRPAPSGYEDKIKLEVKKETARKLQAKYNKSYFEALKPLCDIVPSNSAYPLLKAKMNELDGMYDTAQLQLFAGLVRTAVNCKLLTAQAEHELMAWLHDVQKQMEDDIIAKGQYKKVLSGFAYENEYGMLKYFYDAKIEVVYEEKAKYDLAGILCTPVFSKEYHLNDMSKFVTVKKEFQTELRQYFESDYLDLLKQIKHLPSVVSTGLFEEQCDIVKTRCTEEAYRTFLSYRYRWNIK